MIKQQFFAQHGKHRVGQGRALARPKAPVFTDKTGHHGICRVVKFEGKPDEFRARVKQVFRMHSPLLSYAPPFLMPHHLTNTQNALPDPMVPVPQNLTTPPGLYLHYKGLRYEVIGTARHSETLEPMTVYRALYGDHGLWVRPAAMFMEDVTIDGVVQPRFQPIK